MDKREKYREICESKDIPLFGQFWYLNAVCGQDNWEPIIIEDKGIVIATLPVFKTKKLLFNVIQQPLLCQNNGLWLAESPSKKIEKKMSFEKKTLNKLIMELNKYKLSSYKQNFNLDFKNWLPFFWNGYSQTTRYTYEIKEDQNIDNIYMNFSTRLRTDIRNAEKYLKIDNNVDLEDFYNLNNQVFIRQGIRNPISKKLLKNVVQEAKYNKSCYIIGAFDNNSILQASALFIKDSKRLYYLMSGQNHENRNSGGLSLVLWHAIQIAVESGLIFDFEGSMMENVEKYIRSFGAIQRQYFEISKDYSLLYRFVKMIRGN